jgi:hypothetical protein
MENTVLKAPRSKSLRPFHLANGKGTVMSQQGSKSSAKRKMLLQKRHNQLSVWLLAGQRNSRSRAFQSPKS